MLALSVGLFRGEQQINNHRKRDEMKNTHTHKQKHNLITCVQQLGRTKKKTTCCERKPKSNINPPPPPPHFSRIIPFYSKFPRAI